MTAPRTGSVVSADRVVFNIKGNDYRLVAAIDSDKRIVWIRIGAAGPDTQGLGGDPREPRPPCCESTALARATGRGQSPIHCPRESRATVPEPFGRALIVRRIAR